MQGGSTTPGAAGISDRIPEVFDVYTSANLHVVARIYDPTEPVCISFTYGGQTQIPFAASIAARYRFNLVAVTAKEMDWFQYPELPDAEAAIRPVVCRSSRVVTYGASMGAYGALICSKAVGADVVLAFSPQAAIGPRCPPAESRWMDHRVRIASEFGFPHDDLAERLTRTADIIVGYDPMDADVAHVHLIQAVRPIRRLFMPLGTHETMRFLARMGSASRVVVEVLRDSFCLETFQRDIHQWRRRFHRLEGLSTALLLRNRPVPPALLTRAAWEVPDLHPRRLRQFALEAHKQGNADAMLILLWRLLGTRGYQRQAAFIPDLLAFAPVAARSAEFEDLVAQIASDYSTPVDSVVARHLVLAILHGAAGRKGEGLRHLREAVAEISAWDPINPAVADIFTFLGDRNQAVAMTRRVTVRSGPSFATIEQAARMLEREGNWEEALAMWRDAAASGLSPDRVGLRMGRVLFQLARFPDALEALRPALDAPQPSPDALRLAGACHARLNDHHAACPLFEAAMRAAPNDHQAPRQLANSLTRIGDLAGALAAACKAHEMRPWPAGAAQIERLRLQLGLPA